MARDTERGQPDREAVYHGEEELDSDDGIDLACEDAAREDGVFFDCFREVVEPAC